MQLEGKTALVTGSGRNIGRSIALALAREGADVVVNARSNLADVESVAAEVKELGRKALPLLADVGNRQDLEQLLDTALGEFGHLDIVINNASVRPHKPFAEMSYDDWRGVLAVDLDSAFITSRAAAPGMLERGWGRIINLGGLQAHQGRHGGAHISAAKVGLVWIHPRAGHRTGPPRHTGQLRGAGDDRYVAGRRQRSPHRQPAGRHSGGAHGQHRRYCQPVPVPMHRRRGLHFRPDHPRQRRGAELRGLKGCYPRQSHFDLKAWGTASALTRTRSPGSRFPPAREWRVMPQRSGFASGRRRSVRRSLPTRLCQKVYAGEARERSSLGGFVCETRADT